MKRLYHNLGKMLCFSALLWAEVSFAQSPNPTLTSASDIPRIISYQGQLLRDGKAVKDGNYRITVHLYSDPEGKKIVWSDTYATPVQSGVFSVALGGAKPLPASASLNTPLYVGVQIGDEAELRPLTAFAAAPYALTVPNNSITAEKLDVEYVPGISLNGEKITQKGKELNIVSGPGSALKYDKETGELVVGVAQTSAANSSTYWSETGNNSTTPGTNYVGTSDNVALQIHVNDAAAVGGGTGGYGRVMRYEPNGTSANIIGGHFTNSVTVSKVGGTIAGGGNNTDPNSVTGDYATVSGGKGNTANNASVVGGGDANIASGQYAAIGGGQTNTSIAQFSTVAGGTNNNATQDYAAVGGGGDNDASGEHSTIAGGGGNTASALFSTVGGGNANSVSGSGSVISGGSDNQIAGINSAIAGGEQLKLGNFSFGFNATGTTLTDLSGGNPEFDSIAYFGNASVVIGNTNGAAKELRFYEPNAGHFNYAGNYYTGFKAPVIGTPRQNLIYTLPPVQGAANSVLTNNGSGILSWGPGNGNAWQINGNSGTTPGTNYLGTNDNKDFEIHVNETGASGTGYGRALLVEANSISPSIIGGYKDNSIPAVKSGSFVGGGGKASASNHVFEDFGVVVGGYNNIAGTATFNPGTGGYDYYGDNDFVGGGNSNQASGYSSAVVSGTGNTADGSEAFIGAGTSNHASDNAAVIGGGFSNTASGVQSTIGGGYQSTASGEKSTIAGGDHHFATGKESTVAGGHHNHASGDWSFVGGGGGLANNYPLAFNEASGTNAAVVAGAGNFSSGEFAFIGNGGDREYIESDPALQPPSISHFLDRNLASGNFSSILNGRHNTASGLHSTVLDGYSNNTSGDYTLIGNGFSNTATIDHATVINGAQNTASGIESTILNGDDNTASNFGTLVSGYGNLASGEVAMALGEGLISQSYTQTTLGHFNRAQGSSTTSTINGDDRLLILGNGTSESVRSNAFEVSNNGHSIVFHNTNGSVTSTNPVKGGTYVDNIIYGWGDVNPRITVGGCTINSSFGVVQVNRTGTAGQYNVILERKDPYGGNSPLTQAVVVANVMPASNDPDCYVIYPSAITTTSTQYIFTVNIKNVAGCSGADKRFVFHLVGR